MEQESKRYKLCFSSLSFAVSYQQWIIYWRPHLRKERGNIFLKANTKNCLWVFTFLLITVPKRLWDSSLHWEPLLGMYHKWWKDKTLYPDYFCFSGNHLFHLWFPFHFQFTIQHWRGSFSFIFNSHFFFVVLEFFIFFIFIFYLLIILWGIQQIIKSHFSLSFFKKISLGNNL